MGAIEVRDLRLSYGELRAVDGVSFEVAARAERSGQTTTLGMIEGLRRPDSGSVSLLGSSPWPHNAGLAARIGAQLEASSFFVRLTARADPHLRGPVRRLREARARLFRCETT